MTYDADLAYIHDVGFGGFARRAAPGLLDLLRRRSITDGLVIDLGCGSGIWAAALVRQGYDVLGLDASPAMIRLARKRCPATRRPGRGRARFAVGSLYDAELPPCVAVTVLGEGLNYRAPDRPRRPNLGRLFRRVAQALHPGGLFIFDVVLARPGAERRIERSSRLGSDWAVIMETDWAATGNHARRRITTFRRIGSRYRRAEETHDLWLHSREAILARLRDAGFRVQPRRRYGDQPMFPGRLAFVARKPP